MALQFDSLTVVLANGAFPVHPVPTALLAHARRLICCDGAAASLLASGFTPELVIGDGDSLAPELRARLGERVLIDRDQETNDLSKALRLCRDRGWSSLTVLGATGKRMDHALGNLSLLADFATDLSLRAFTDFGIITPLRGPARLPSFPGQAVSFIACEAGLTLSASGLAYPVKDLVLRRWWQATLNRATGQELTLDFACGAALLVFQSYPGPASDSAPDSADSWLSQIFPSRS